LVIRKAQGFALIDLIFVCGIIGLLSSIALPRLMLAQQAAGAASAIGTMRMLASGQLTFALTCGNGFYAPSLTALGTPPAGSTEPFITPGLTTGDTVIRSGYLIQLEGLPYVGAPSTCNGLGADEAAQGFRAGADPTGAGNARFFAVNANASIYEHTSTIYADMPEVGIPPSGQVLH